MINQSQIVAQVAEIREAAEVFLLDTLYIKRYTGKTVVRGETTLSYADPVAVKCRIINRSGADNVPVASQFRAIQQKTNVALLRVQLPFNAEITLDDILIINDHEYTPLYIQEKHELMGAFMVYLEKRS